MIDSAAIWNLLADFGGRSAGRARAVAIVGAPKTGKSILTIAFVHSQRECFHSFGRVLRFNFPTLPAEVEYGLNMAITDGIVRGMAGQSSFSGDSEDEDATASMLDDRPRVPIALQFGISGRSRARYSGLGAQGPEVVDAPITIRDCPGALLALDNSLDSKRQAAVDHVCQESDAIILCLPLSGPELNDHRNAVLRFIGDLTKSLGPGGGGGKRLILALTKSELAIAQARKLSRTQAAGPRGPNSSPNRIGWTICDWALPQPLRQSLSILMQATQIEVWAAPVSAYGFVGGNGAPNVFTRKSGDLAGEELLLMSPAALTQIQQDLGLQGDDIGKIDVEACLAAWMPFRIADPIIMAALDPNRLNRLMSDIQTETMIVQLSKFLAERY